MTAASALIAGNDPDPELAAEAVRQALSRAGSSHANGILLILSPEFARIAQAAVHAASRAGNCLHVSGGIAAAVANERTWVFDRPAAAALVLCADHALSSSVDGGDWICIAADSSLPVDWRTNHRRTGILFQDPLIRSRFPAWQAGRISEDHRSSTVITGATAHSTVATGLRRIGPQRIVTKANAFELAMLDSTAAVDALVRVLPAECRQQGSETGLPLHQVCLMIGAEESGDFPRLVPLLAANGDRSLTLGDRISVGDVACFAIRQPVDAERDIRTRLDELCKRSPDPAFGIYFSCIGRGPYMYSGDERDWDAIRQRFPGMPFIGAYGQGQIASLPEPRLLQNSVVVTVYA